MIAHRQRSGPVRSTLTFSSPQGASAGPLARIMPRQVLLSTLGSLGDLHPFIAIALRLQERGYDTVIATSPQYRENVSMEGIGFQPIGPTREKLLSDLNMSTGELGRKISADTMFILEGIVFPYLRSMYDDLSAVVDRSSLVLSSSLMFAARFAAEARAIAHLTVALQPMVFISSYDPPCIPQAPWLAPLLSKLGRTTTNVVYGVAKRLLTRRARALYEFRETLGLPQTQSNLLFDGQFSPRGTLALYSSLLGSAQPICVTSSIAAHRRWCSHWEALPSVSREISTGSGAKPRGDYISGQYSWSELSKLLRTVANRPMRMSL
jgi:rhamnosyltransferase subunit B